MDLEPALHVDSHLQLVFVRPRSMTARTDDNKAAARFGIDAVVCPHEGARSFAVTLVRSVLLFYRVFSHISSVTYSPRSTWTTARTRAESDGNTVDAKGTADNPATTPSLQEIFGRGREPSFIAALFPL